MSLQELTKDWVEEGFKKFWKWAKNKQRHIIKNATTFTQIVSVLLIIGFCSSPGLAVRNLVIKGYREAQWGMSPDEVKGAFPNKSFAELEHPWDFLPFLGKRQSEEQKITYYFWYQDEILDSKVPVSFFFFENQLYKVEVDGGGLSYFSLDLIKTLLRLLMEKYGFPTYSNEADFQWRWDDGGNHQITLTKYGIEYLDLGTRNKITQLIQEKEKQTEKEALGKL